MTFYPHTNFEIGTIFDLQASIYCSYRHSFDISLNRIVFKLYRNSSDLRFPASHIQSPGTMAKL